MNFRVPWITSQEALELLSDPYLSELQSWFSSATTILHPHLYISHNATTQQTTIITTDLNWSHLWMVQHLKELSGGSIQREEIGRLMTQCFVVVLDCFRATAQWWDSRASGEVCNEKFHLRSY